MLKLSNIKVPAYEGDAGLSAAVSRAAGAPAGDIVILRRSVDARRRDDVHFSFTVAASFDDERAVMRRCRNASAYAPDAGYSFPCSFSTPVTRPLVVGMGPAGLFAALCLAEAGLPCTVIDRGQSVERRAQDVRRFWETGKLDTESNVQFGEGGAGTFSDGKLTTGINDKRTGFIFRRFVEFGAPPDILYLSKPHVGTDRLRTVVANMRARLLELGCDVRFGHRLDGLTVEDGRVRSAEIACGEGFYALDTDRVILAPGNSARDTFEMLKRSGISISCKSFSVGVRIEHRQADIDAAQYGQAATLGTLPRSDYKLAVHLDGGRSVYTFCVCPGGSVVAAASETGGVVTNGMSEYARDGTNCNGGLLVSLTPEDFGGDPMAAIEFQRELERAAYRAGGGGYSAPAQLVGDFLSRTPSEKPRSVTPTYEPGVRMCDLGEVLPDFVCDALREAIPEMGKRVRGFDSADAVLTAVETRSSSPVRIDRLEYRSVSAQGLYPCGEGAGYAGGIVSASADGIRCAEALCADVASAIGR